MTTLTPVSPLAALAQLAIDAVPSQATKRAYRTALSAFLAHCSASCAPFTRATVQAYRAQMLEAGRGAVSINIALSAIRKLASEACDNGLLDPTVAGGIARVEGCKRLGQRLGMWLTLEQTATLLQVPSAVTLSGKRDRTVLCILFGCALRRTEAVTVTVEQFQMREGRWCLVDVLGKGSKIRTTPIPSWAVPSIQAWIAASGITEGPLLRQIDKQGRVQGGFSAHRVFQIVEKYGNMIGVRLRPHDCRRTTARLAHEGGAPIDQIMHTLGHSSIATSERYLGIRQNLRNAPCDAIRLLAPTG